MIRDNLIQFFRSSRVHLIVGLFVVIPFLVSNISFLSNHLNTTFDDSYMFFRYAGNVLDGHGIAWNPDGVQTYGVTSLLYLFVIVLTSWMFPAAGSGPVLTVTSFVLGSLAMAVLIVWSFKAGISEFVRRYRFLFPFLVMIVLISSDHYLLHSTSGMDTTLALLCNVLLVITTLEWTKRPIRSNLIQLVLAAYACFLARPDLLLYAVLFPLLYAWYFLSEERSKNLIRFCLIISLILLADTFIKNWMFGDPLPLPFYTKRVGFYDGYRGGFMWNPISYLFQFFRLMFPFITILLFTTTARNWRLVVAFFSPVLLTFFYFFSVTQVMGFWARYYFPAIPFFVIASFLTLDQRINESQPMLKLNIFFRGAITAFVMLFLFLPLLQSAFEKIYETRIMPQPRIYRSELSRNLKDILPDLGWRRSIVAMSGICSQLPADTRVAMSEYGLVGASAPQILIIDLLGLHDPFFARNGFSTTELFNRKPDLIWFPPPEYSKIFASIQDAPTLLEDYDYFPGVFDTGLAIRRDSEHYELILEILAKTWLEYYPGVEIKRYPNE